MDSPHFSLAAALPPLPPPRRVSNDCWGSLVLQIGPKDKISNNGRDKVWERQHWAELATNAPELKRRLCLVPARSHPERRRPMLRGLFYFFLSFLVLDFSQPDFSPPAVYVHVAFWGLQKMERPRLMQSLCKCLFFKPSFGFTGWHPPVLKPVLGPSLTPLGKREI